MYVSIGEFPQVIQTIPIPIYLDQPPQVELKVGLTVIEPSQLMEAEGVTFSSQQTYGEGSLTVLESTAPYKTGVFEVTLSGENSQNYLVEQRFVAFEI